MTPKQAIFLEEYLVDGNGTRAAIAAGVSESNAAVTASRWLKVRTIAQAIAVRQAKRAQKLEVTGERVIKELAKIAFSDVRDLFKPDGQLKQITELDDIAAASIAGIDVTEEKVDTDVLKDGDGKVTQTTVTRSWTKKLKLADKTRALELLGKNQKLFTDLHEHSGKLTLEDLVVGGNSEEAA